MSCGVLQVWAETWLPGAQVGRRQQWDPYQGKQWGSGAEESGGSHSGEAAIPTASWPLWAAGWAGAFALGGPGAGLCLRQLILLLWAGLSVESPQASGLSRSNSTTPPNQTTLSTMAFFCCAKVGWGGVCQG